MAGTNRGNMGIHWVSSGVPVPSSGYIGVCHVNIHPIVYILSVCTFMQIYYTQIKNVQKNEMIFICSASRTRLNFSTT